MFNLLMLSCDVIRIIYVKWKEDYNGVSPDGKIQKPCKISIRPTDMFTELHDAIQILNIVEINKKCNKHIDFHMIITIQFRNRLHS